MRTWYLKMPLRHRSNDGARRQQTNQPVYEDFQPMLERNEEAANHIITLHLPGFTKEQLRVISMYDPRAIRIRGERPILNNKRSRFNQEITVPPKCDLNKIHAKFQDDILTIKIPKHVPPKLTSYEVDKTIPETTPSSTSKAPADQQKAQKSKEEETVQRAKTDPKSQKIEDKVSSKQETPSTSKAPEQPKPQKVQDSSVLPKTTPITVGADKQKDEKSFVVSPIAHKPSADQPQMQKATQEEVVQKPIAKHNFQKLDEKKLGEVKANEKEKAAETILQKEKEREDEKGKESSGSADHEKVLPKIKENKEIDSKKRGRFKEEKPKEDCDQTTKNMMGIKNVKETATEALNNVLMWVKDEEMQHLVNVGVAAVVLVGFGAYVSYSFGSSG